MNLLVLTILFFSSLVCALLMIGLRMLEISYKKIPVYTEISGKEWFAWYLHDIYTMLTNRLKRVYSIGHKILLRILMPIERSIFSLLKRIRKILISLVDRIDN